MSGFGAGSCGSTPFGSGGGGLLIEAAQLTRNSVRVGYGGGVQAQNPGAIWDALYDRGWRLEAYVPHDAHVPRVVHVERAADGAQAVVLYLDAELDGPGVLYRVVGSERVFAASAARALFRSFGGAGVKRTAIRQELSFDLANLQTGGAAPGELEQPLGTLSLDADGDYRTDAGIESLKKRVIRRLTTRLGAYAHLPDYGLRIRDKRLVKAGDLRDLQAQAMRQVRLELGVNSVRVAVSTPSPGIIALDVEVEARGQSFGVSVKI